MDAARFHFLFRSDAGEIDRATWMRCAGALAAIAVVLTTPWLWLRGHIVHDLSKDEFFDPSIFAAYAYALAYAFALILLGVSYVNLTAKRFRALGWRNPLGLASLVPLIAFLSGALRLAPILSPAGADIAPIWAIWGAEAIFAGVAGWTVWELGIREKANE
jgi:uncharacterized membrane protein YhaH (DUF805 family)